MANYVAELIFSSAGKLPCGRIPGRKNFSKKKTHFRLGFGPGFCYSCVTATLKTVAQSGPETMDKNLLYKYFKGEASPSERKAVRTWKRPPTTTTNTSASVNSSTPRCCSRRVVRSPLKARLLRLGRMAAAAAVFALGSFVPAPQYPSRRGALCSASVPMGQRVNLQLADGTDVWPNSGSEFIIPRHFRRATAGNASTARAFQSGEGRQTSFPH